MVTRDQSTIHDVLSEFLAEQRERLSAKTFRNYEEVVELLRHSLDGYAYTSLPAGEHQRWERAFESGDEHAFCRLFGPEKIPEHLGEFLGYFMVRKVMASQQLLKASGTVTGCRVRSNRALGGLLGSVAHLPSRRVDAECR